MTLPRNSIVVGFVDLKDQFVCAQQRQQPTDACGCDALSQDVAQVSITEALQRKLPMHNCLKQAGVFRANRSQGTILPLSFDSLADAIQQAIGRSFQPHHGQAIQITSVSTETQLGPAPQISDAQAHWQPFHKELTFTPSFAPYLETSGV